MTLTHEHEERVIDEVREARAIAYAKGYTPEHDDEHGLEHLAREATYRLMPFPDGFPTRADLVAAAGLTLSAIFHLDRLAEEPDYDEGFIGDE